jgi:hypothetical protein
MRFAGAVGEMGMLLELDADAATEAAAREDDEGPLAEISVFQRGGRAGEGSRQWP